jgi:hypothetical protein
MTKICTFSGEVNNFIIIKRLNATLQKFYSWQNRWEICLRMRYNLRGLRERDLGE